MFTCQRYRATSSFWRAREQLLDKRTAQPCRVDELQRESQELRLGAVREALLRTQCLSIEVRHTLGDGDGVGEHVALTGDRFNDSKLQRVGTRESSRRRRGDGSRGARQPIDED